MGTLSDVCAGLEELNDEDLERLVIEIRRVQRSRTKAQLPVQERGNVDHWFSRVLAPTDEPR